MEKNRFTGKIPLTHKRVCVPDPNTNVSLPSFFFFVSWSVFLYFSQFFFYLHNLAESSPFFQDSGSKGSCVLSLVPEVLGPSHGDPPPSGSSGNILYFFWKTLCTLDFLTCLCLQLLEVL